MQLERHTFAALGGANEIQLYAPDGTTAAMACRMLEAEARLVESTYSRYRLDSIISRINASAGGEAIEVDGETAALLDYADVCFKQSDGLFDITSGVLRRVWDFKRGIVPSKEAVQEVLPLIGWNLVEWKSPFIRLPRVGMEIDFGGIGKEYAADRLASRAAGIGIRHALINLAGDVRVIGAHPDGAPWRVGITHPRGGAEPIGYLELKTGAVATSGDYERFFEQDGVRYCHILNPKTGYPVTGMQSVSVVADSCLVAGSASTIAMLLGGKGGIGFLRSLGLTSTVVKEDGQMVRISHRA